MSKTVDFYYDYISPASYIGWSRVQKIANKTGATINYKPMLLGAVLKAQNGTSPINSPAKWAWIQADFQRYADKYHLPYNFNPHFIFSTITALRGALWAKSLGRIEDYNAAIFTAAWVEEKNLSDNDVIIQVLTKAGFDGEAVLHATQQPEGKAALLEATNEAIDQGVFGAPTFIVDGELHFGQDRLEWVEAAIKR